MIRIKKMRKFVHDHIINTGSRIKRKTGIECNYGTFRTATTPSRAHNAQFQLGHRRRVTKERIYCLKAFPNVLAQFLFRKSLERFPFFLTIFDFPQNEDQIFPLNVGNSALRKVNRIRLPHQRDMRPLITSICVSLFLNTRMHTLGFSRPT